MGIFSDWSFRKSNNTKSKVESIDPLSIALFNKMKTSKRYNDLVSEVSIETFLGADFEIFLKRKRSGIRYIEFVWDDLCEKSIELRFDVDENTPKVVLDKYLQLQMVNRKFTKMHNLENQYYPDPRSMASI